MPQPNPPTDVPHPPRPEGFFAAFTAHPASVGESYGQHMRFALRFSARLFVAGAAAAVHAIVPAWCETTASRQVEALCREMRSRARGE